MTLTLSLAWKTECLGDRPGGFAYRHMCYSDAAALYENRDLALFTSLTLDAPTAVAFYPVLAAAVTLRFAIFGWLFWSLAKATGGLPVPAAPHRVAAKA